MNMDPALLENALQSARNASGKSRHDLRTFADQVKLQLFILALILLQQGLQAELNSQQYFHAGRT